MVRGSRTDCLRVDSNTITIAIPFVAQANDRDLRIREFVGRMSMYRIGGRKLHLDKRLLFIALGKNIPQEIEEMVETFNNEQL